MNRWTGDITGRNRLIVCMISILLVLFLSSCRKEEKTVQKPAIRPIRTVVVGAPDADRERSFSGIARASVETKLSFRVGGEIERLPVVIGRKVKKGDLVATLDATDFKLALNQAKAGLALAEAQLNRAKADYERDRQLYEAEDISRSQLDRSIASWRSSKAQVDSAGESVNLARRKLSYTTLRAPMGGSIASVPVEAHQTVGAGRTVATLTSGGEMEIEVGIPESLITRIAVGDPATVVFDAIAGKTLEARVKEVGVQASDAAVYPVTLRINERNDRLRPGMVGEITLNFTADEAYITIPLVAVVTNPGGKRFVWIYGKEKGTVSKREITVGKLTSRGLQVEAGLTAGEIIAVRGVHRLSENMKVRLLDRDGAAGEAAP